MSYPAVLQRHHPISLELILLSLGALVLRVIRLDSRALWWDEGRNLFFAELDWVTAAQTAVRSGDTNPPIYRMLLSVWMRFVGPSPFAIRLLSAFIGVITVVLLYRIAADIFGRRVAIIAGAMATASPTLVYYSQEAKGYPLVILAVVLSVWIWLHLHRPFLYLPGSSARMPSPWSFFLWPLFSVATLLAVGSHFFALLFILVENLWTLALTWRAIPHFSLRRIMVHWMAWLGSQCLAGAFLVLYVSQSAATLLGAVDVPHLGLSLLPRLTSADLARWGATTEVVYDEPSRRLLSFLWSFAEEMVGSPDTTPGLAVLALLALVPTAYLGTRHWSKVCHGFVWISWLVLPLLLSSVFVLKFRYFYPRFLLFVLPAILLPSASGIEWLLRSKIRAAVLLTIGLIVAWGGTLRLHYTNPGDPAEDWRALISTFSHYQKPGDLAVHSYDWITGYLHSYLSPGLEPDYFHYIKGEEAALEHAGRNLDRMWFFDYKASPFDVGNQAGADMRAQAAVAYTQGFGNSRLTLFVMPSYVLNPLDIAHVTNVLFDRGVELQWTPFDADVLPRDVIAVELVWHAPEATLPQYQVFLHVLDLDGRLIVGRDSGPVNDLRPTNDWGPGERVSSLHAVLLPPDLATDEYQVHTGLYELDSGIRLTTADGGDSVLLGRVTQIPE